MLARVAVSVSVRPDGRMANLLAMVGLNASRSKTA